ncbi:MAG TPA: gliding motility-associated C-terminal domain-containing protein, partial [Flavobacterium sp.]|nr:gliding motility-associated C-terminal domain-containing protein [Flavobacterium sp.]
TAGQCASATTMTITVNQPTMPGFTAVGPICSGTALNALPTTSNNGITGSWSPALNNTATTIYTFTPTAGQCASIATLTITVNQSTTTPTFTAVAPICSGTALSALPTTSNNGITGTWSPALDNTATTIYTFTPTVGQCASIATLTITVNQSTTTPTFTAVDPICSGGTLSALPTTSNNGITGTWSPALNNTATTIYTFTPTAGQCASTTTLTITVNASLDFTISEGCDGINYTLSAVQDNASNPLYAWFDPAGTQIGTGSSVVISTPGVYELVVTQGGCSVPGSINVLSTYCGIQKGISPNNDGLNDNFDLEAYNVKELKIFNRYGTNVYSKANYQNEWVGQSDNGKELPDGTYYYVIDFADLKTKTGWIYSIREQ